MLLLTTVFILPLTNVVREQADDKTIYNSALKIKKDNYIGYNSSVTKKDKISTAEYNDSDIVNITVELSKECLAEEFLKTTEDDIPTFLASNNAKKITADIQNEQQTFISDLKKTIGSQWTSSTRTTSVVMNSVSFSCTYDKLSEIKALDNVKHAYVSTALYPMADKNTTDDSTPDADSKDSELIDEQGIDDSDSFNGSGTVIAVLDTGFDVDHDIFSSDCTGEKYSQDEFMNLLSTLTQCTEGEYSATDLYNNQRVLFSYDYADDDNNVSVDISSHGTMSAGIAAGDSETIPYSGNAYNSQILMMKCSPDSSENTDSVSILLATEDSVKLGADVINIGYGSTANLSTDLSQSFGAMFDRIYKCGTAVVMPSGNSGKNILTEDNSKNPEIIDYGTASQFSSLSGVLSVSAAEDLNIYKNYFICNKEKIIYSTLPISDGSNANSLQSMNDGNYNYIVLEDNDESMDTESDLSGKIAFISVDSRNIDEKIKNVIDRGAAAAVIFSDNKVTASDLPTIPITVVYEYDISSLEKSGEITLSGDFIIKSENENYGKISETASYGSNGSLSVGADITDIASHYSSILNNRYGIDRGSSFASASVAGKVAALKQYINSDKRFTEYTPKEKNNLVYNLMMSTANIISDNNIPEDVRVQGSGVIDIDNALSSDAYLSVNSSSPKLILGSDADGSYTAKLEITNISEQDITFTPSAFILTENLDAAENTLEHTEVPISDYLIYFSQNGKKINEINVPANETEVISVSVKINSVFILDKLLTYKNGFYIDGFITLSSDDKVSLSAPMLGFVGNYNSQSAFDNFIYDKESPITNESSYIYLASNNQNTDDALILGYNKFLKEYDIDNLSFNSKTFSTVTDKNASDISLYIRSIAIRDIKNFKCTVKNENGNIVFESSPFNRNKYSVGDELTSINTKLSSLSDGKYIITLNGTIEESKEVSYEQSKTFTFTVDSKKPVNTSYRTYYSNDKTYLEVKGKDNCGIQGFDIYVAVYNGKTGKYEYSDSLFDLMKDTNIPIYGDTITLIEHHDTENGETVFTYDITKLKDMLKRLADNYDNASDSLKISQNKVAFAAVDYAYNRSEIKLCDTIIYDDLTLKFVDSNGNPVKGINVEINKRSFVSDENGKITYASIPAGEYKVNLIKIPNNLCVEKNPFSITAGDVTSDSIKTITLMPEGTYAASDNSRPASPSLEQSDKNHDPEQKRGDELNPKEPQPEDTNSSIFALIIVAALLAVSIAAFLISKKKFKW